MLGDPNTYTVKSCHDDRVQVPGVQHWGTTALVFNVVADGLQHPLLVAQIHSDLHLCPEEVEVQYGQDMGHRVGQWVG